MSPLLNTKPKHVESVATENGWADPITGEVYTVIKSLKSKLDADVIPESKVYEKRPIVKKEEVKIEKPTANKKSTKSVKESEDV